MGYGTACQRDHGEDRMCVLDKRLPQTYTEIREFLGMVNHYRRFIKDCSKVSQLDLKALKAFHELKTALTEAPVLAYAVFSQPFLLETDA